MATTEDLSEILPSGVATGLVTTYCGPQGLGPTRMRATIRLDRLDLKVEDAIEDLEALAAYLRGRLERTNT